MATKKTPAERVAEYKARAAQIEQREARKLRAKSPQWKATKRARAAIAEAITFADENVPADVALADALEAADAVLAKCAAAQIEWAP